MLWYVTDWGWSALWRRLARVLSGRGVRVEGRCLRCGQCCRTIVLHSGGRWIRGEKYFEKEKARAPELARFVPHGEDEDGRLVFHCTLLTEEGLCGDHEHRPDLCRNHPNASVFYSGVALMPYCGYRFRGPGLRDVFRLPPKRPRGGAGVSFEEALERERTRNTDNPNGTS